MRTANRQQNSTGRADEVQSDGAAASGATPGEDDAERKKRPRITPQVVGEANLGIPMGDDHIVASSTSASSSAAVAGSTLGSAPSPDEGSLRVKYQHANGRPAMPKPTDVGMELEVAGTKRKSDGDDSERAADVAVRDEVYEQEPPAIGPSAGPTGPAPMTMSEEDNFRMYGDIGGDDSMDALKPTRTTSVRTQPGTKSGGKWNKDVMNIENKLSDGDRLRNMECVKQKLGCKVAIGEIYSPPRVVTVAQAMGVRDGFSLDLTAPMPDGKVWDLSKPHYRLKAIEVIRREKPCLLIGRPPCTAWSVLQNLNKCRPGGEAQVADCCKDGQEFILNFVANSIGCKYVQEGIFCTNTLNQLHHGSSSAWKS